MSDAFCSLTGARTFLTTNLVHLDIFRTDQVLSVLSGEDPAGVDPEKLPDVIHESIHHWCFNTPVGVALALNHGRLTEHAMTDRRPYRMRKLLIRHRVTTEILRPLIEGLACFGEFDVYPDQGNLRVSPLPWVCALARPRETREKGRSPTGLDELARAVLRNVRLSKGMWRRKEILLSQPLDPARRGGYLTGYLLVKGWQAALAASDAALSGDSELLLSFLHSYFFSDYALANELLRPLPEGSSTAGEDDVFAAPLDRVRERLHQLSNGAWLADCVRAYNDAWDPALDDNPNNSRSVALCAALSLSETESSAWTDSYQAAWERFTESTGDEWISKIRGLQRFQLQNRHWMCVSSINGHLQSRCDGSLTFTLDGGDSAAPLMSRGPIDFPEDSLSSKLVCGDFDIDDASFECWLGPRHHGVCVVASNVGVHAWFPLWASDRYFFEDFMTTIRSNRAMVYSAQGVQTSLDKLLARQPWVNDLKNNIARIVRDELREQALLAVELFDGSQAFAEALWEEGFYGLFADLHILRAASIAGVSTSVGLELVTETRAADRYAQLMKHIEASAQPREHA